MGVNMKRMTTNSSFSHCFFQRKKHHIKVLMGLLVAITSVIPLIVLSITTQQQSKVVILVEEDNFNQHARGGGKVQKTSSSLSSSSLPARNNVEPPAPLLLSTSHGKEWQGNNADQSETTAAAAISSVFVPLLQRNITPPLPVVLYPYVIMGSMGKQDATVALDGLYESPLVTLVSNITSSVENLVWVVDQGAARAPLPIWCRNLVQVIRNVQNQRKQQQHQGGANVEAQLPLSWPVHIVQVSDDSTIFSQCKAATEKLLQPQHVMFFKRSLIVQRYWNETIQWVNIGQFIQNQAYRQGILKHLGIPVRTDLVQALETHLLSQHFLPPATTNTDNNKNKYMTLAFAIEELERTMDVAHFWPLQDYRLDEVNRDDGRLRDAVSHAIIDLQNVTILRRYNNKLATTTSTTIRLFVDTVGAGREQGRNTVQIDYLRQLLDTKIVVVAQRDGWEDHYRLLEGIIAGACVFTDVMLTLPRGLKNGTSIVEYSSTRNLQDLILYYLEHDEERIRIAKTGRDVAMRYHRSWHKMEEVLFGQPISICQPNQDIEVCNPWVVHAKDMYPKQHQMVN